jgi:hypothetical protein
MVEVLVTESGCCIRIVKSYAAGGGVGGNNWAPWRTVHPKSEPTLVDRELLATGSSKLDYSDGYFTG